MTTSVLDPARTPSTIATALSGAAATFAGNGLARFAYVPLFPAMVAAGWVTGAEAGLLGAINLTGYLVGVLGAGPLAHRLGTRAALAAGMAFAFLAFAACGWNGGVVWLAGWRGLAGIAGGILMAIAGPAVQGAVPPARRGLAGGIVITGVGAGIVVSALAMPWFLSAGVGTAWLGLGAITAVLAIAAGPSWPSTPVGSPRGVVAVPGSVPLYLAYGLSAAGLVPHLVYFSDLALRGRGYSATLASAGWLLFGLGGCAGPIVGGRAADRLGALPVLRIFLGLQAAALALVFVPGGTPLLLSAFVGGVAAIGLSSLALARAREIAGPASGGVWVRATATWALAQATTGFALAALFARTGSHDVLFATGLAFSLAAFLPVLRSARRA